MIEPHTICDLCTKDVTGAAALEVRVPYQEMHVCSGCLGRPIWDLAEKARCLQIAHEKAMMAGAMECQPCMAPVATSQGLVGRLAR